jgi:hypothetical protein
MTLFPDPLCSHELKVEDARGKHVKTACIVYKEVNFGGASTSCSSNGLKLLKSTSENDFKAIKNYIEKQKLSDHRFWIHGDQKSDKCSVVDVFTSEIKYMRCSLRMNFLCEL